MLPQVHVVNSSQGRFLTFGHDFISEKLFTEDNWEKWLIDVTNLCVAGFDAPLVFDIGANLGAWTVPVAASIAERNGVVCAFEAQRTVYYQLCGNVFLNRLDNVVAFNYAVGQVSGDIFLPIPDYDKTTNNGAFSLIYDHAEKKYGCITLSQKQHPVQVVRLDDMIPEEPIRFLKIDVEGMELEVLKGACGLLEQHSYPPFSFEAWRHDEFHAEKQELMQFIAHLGYRVESIRNDDYLAFHPASEVQIDIERDSRGVITALNRLR